MGLKSDLEMARRIAEKVKSLGGETYFVGGYVRDKILKRENKDIDIEVHGISSRELRSILDELGECITKGASFGVFGLNHYGLDISMPREELSSGRGHRDFEVFVNPFIGLKKACSRRDFTMNALMENVMTGEIIDFYGGINDLKNKVIRHVDDETFLDDPLRVLRAAQFAARFNFTIAEDTVLLSQTADLKSLSSERILTELEKALLKSNKPSIFFEELRKMNQLSVWFPELEALIDIPQNPLHHPEGDVWNHTMMVLDEAAKLRSQAKYPFPFMLSALYHDIGKPSTLSLDEKGYHNYEHHTIGAEMIYNIPYIKENFLLKYMNNMISKHMEPNANLKRYYKNENHINTFCKMFDSSICPEDLILLGKADYLGRRNRKDKDYDRRLEDINEFLRIYKERTKEPYITGKFLIENGFKPGVEFSEAIQLGHKLQVAGVPKNQIISQVMSYMKKKERIKAWNNKKNDKRKDKNLVKRKEKEDFEII